MSKLVPVVFFSVMAASVVGMDYYFQRGRLAAPDTGVTAYVALRLADYKLSLSPASLATALPQQIDGWKIHSFGADDLKILIGAPPTKQQAEGFADTKGKQAFGLLMAQGVKRVDLALYKGETGIRLTGTYLAASGGMQTQALSMQNSFMKMLSDRESAGPKLFSTVQGVEVQELPAKPEDDAGLRQFRATLTDAITVTASTRSQDDADIREAFAAVDFVQLNGLLEKPLPGIDAAAPLILPASETAEAAAGAGPGSAVVAGPEEPSPPLRTQAWGKSPAFVRRASCCAAKRTLKRFGFCLQHIQRLWQHSNSHKGRICGHLCRGRWPGLEHLQ